jgi:hypothetical protein
VTSGRPFGAPAWVAGMAAALDLRLSSRPRGRPRKESPSEKPTDTNFPNFLPLASTAIATVVAASGGHYELSPFS